MESKQNIARCEDTDADERLIDTLILSNDKTLISLSSEMDR